VSRPQLTKMMWAYFKSNKLMDPADKRFVLCDAKLKALTGEARFQAFSFMKVLGGRTGCFVVLEGVSYCPLYVQCNDCTVRPISW
jgi:hypothetical protein